MRNYKHNLVIFIIISPSYLEQEDVQSLPLVISTKVRSAQFHPHRAVAVVLYNYNNAVL